MKSIFEWLWKLRYEGYAKRLRSSRIDKIGDTLLEFGRVNDGRVLPLILPFLTHTEPFVRWCAVSSLLERKEAYIVEPLLNAYSMETDPFVRLWMAVVLANLGRADGMETIFDDIALVDADGKEDWDGAEQIWLAIGNLGKTAMPYLEKSISHPTPVVRWITVNTFGEIDDERIDNLLEKVQYDEHETVRTEAKRLLEEQEYFRSRQNRK